MHIGFQKISQSLGGRPPSLLFLGKTHDFMLHLRDIVCDQANTKEATKHHEEKTRHHHGEMHVRSAGGPL